MKTNTLILGIILVAFASCKILMGEKETRFSSDIVNLGMSKKTFVETFGNPTMQNSFFADGVLIDELVYMETIYFRNEPRKINSIFVFENEKLVRREQYEDIQYQREQEFKSFIEKYKQEEAPKKE